MIIIVQRGDQYVLRAGQLICRTDFEKELYMMQGFGPIEQRCKNKCIYIYCICTIYKFF